MKQASLVKRLLAIFYDLLIIFFITFLLTIVFQQLVIQLELITLEKVQITQEGETVNVIPASSPVSFLLKSIWFFISLFYFGHYWTKHGQTLGMRVWKIKVVSNQDTLISWYQAIKRYLFALLGLGLFWIIVDKENLALQDRLSQSKLLSLSVKK